MRIGAGCFIAALVVALAGCATELAETKSVPEYRFPTAQRIPVEVTSSERDFVLNEMRFFLDMLTVIADAISREDMNAVAVAARRRGAVGLARIPPEIFSRMPAQYQTLARQTHEKIDQIATDAETTRKARSTLAHLSQLLSMCNNCHSNYQFVLVSGAPGPKR